MMKGTSLAYQKFIPRFREIVRRSVPLDATVVILSKGDSELLQLGGPTAWHFPQREDGVYAGYYPSDSAAAIAHLELLRKKGADYLIFPQIAFWWLDHYSAFRRHLESNYPIVTREKDTCLIFALDGSAPERDNQIEEAWLVSSSPKTNYLNSGESLDEHLINDLKAIFDLEYYARQAGAFTSIDTALIDYLENGFSKGYSPCALFDPAYYVSRYLPAGAARSNPLLLFLRNSNSELQNPNPYFDTEFYFSQHPPLRASGMNALVHYLTQVTQGRAQRPNPLFANGFYYDNYPDVKRAGVNPLAHFLSTGHAERRFASPIHKNIVHGLLGASKKHLFRGNWRNGTILFFAETATHAEMLNALEIAEALETAYHLRCMIVFLKRGDGPVADFSDSNLVILEDFQAACDILRTSALRLLVKSLRGMKPLFALTPTPDVLDMLRAEGIPSIFLESAVASQSGQALATPVAPGNCELSDSSADFQSAAQRTAYCQTNMAMRGGPAESVTSYVGSLVEMAKREFQLPEITSLPKQRRAASTTNQIFIPCSDWALSGVNSAVEAIGKELIRLGWDVTIVFTRDAASVAKTITHDRHLPEIPYRYLEIIGPGFEGMWEALIVFLEMKAPCIMLMAYDFAANSVAPALTEKVGVLAWAQSDDNDYYEQAYRLGRYCNAVVCVSEHIKARVTELNPAIGARAHVIHNSSVRTKQIAKNKPARSKRMRLIYTGRLVHYQKRILDIVDLAAGLDRLEVRYEITIVGSFSQRENTEEIFRRRAQAHLADGRIKLPGRMTRNETLEELSRNDFFVLLSDFEGMPLSLIEAMARGCVPVVAKMQSGVPEVVTDQQNGLVIGGRNYDEWARRLVKCWRDTKSVSRMSAAARKTVRQQFTVERVGTQFSELCAQIASQICSGEYTRPACLNWGARRSPAGDILPPPSLFSLPIQLPTSVADVIAPATHTRQKLNERLKKLGSTDWCHRFELGESGDFVPAENLKYRLSVLNEVFASLFKHRRILVLNECSGFYPILIKRAGATHVTANNANRENCEVMKELSSAIGISFDILSHALVLFDNSKILVDLSSAESHDFLFAQNAIGGLYHAASRSFADVVEACSHYVTEGLVFDWTDLKGDKSPEEYKRDNFHSALKERFEYVLSCNEWLTVAVGKLPLEEDPKKSVGTPFGG